MSENDSTSLAVGSAGAAVAIGVGGLLVPVRDVIGNTNVALVLVVVIVAAAAFGGRMAGVVTAGAACLSFNFFHTEPLVQLADSLGRGHLDRGAAVHHRPRRWPVVRVRSQQPDASRSSIGRVSPTSRRSVRWSPRASRSARCGPLYVPRCSTSSRSLTQRSNPATMPTHRWNVLKRNGRFDNKVMFWNRGGMELPRDGIAIAGAAPEPAPSVGSCWHPTRGRERPPTNAASRSPLSDLLAVTIDRHPPAESTSSSTDCRRLARVGGNDHRDALDEIGHVERLRDVVVGTQFERLAPRALVVAHRQHDDRNVVHSRSCLENRQPSMSGRPRSSSTMSGISAADGDERSLHRCRPRATS